MPLSCVISLTEMIEIGFYLVKPPGPDYVDLSEYGEPFTKNIGRSVGYVNEMRRVFFPDNNMELCQKLVKSVQYFT